MLVWGGSAETSVHLYCACTDADHDEVCAGDDPFPASDARPTVVIGECDSGVANEFVSPGANMNDLIGACEASARNEGDLASCIARLTNEWNAGGWIDGREKSRIQRCATAERAVEARPAS